MKSLFTYTKRPDADGIYSVQDATSNLSSIGTVARVGRYGPWVAIPAGQKADGSSRKGFTTRSSAAYALARFGDTGNRLWIYPETTS